MKRIHIFLFLFVTCFILNGCGAQNPSDSGPEAKDHTTATGNTTLPESTITWFNTEYFNSGDSVNMRNMLLSSQYSTIADTVINTNCKQDDQIDYKCNINRSHKYIPPQRFCQMEATALPL